MMRGTLKIFVKDQRAASEAISYLALALVVIYILVQFVEIVNIEVSNIAVVMAYKKGLDRMQIDGGLTEQTKEDIKKYLADFGLDSDKVTVDGTSAHQDWGNDVYLSVSYKKEYYKYSLVSLMDLRKTKDSKILFKDGTTTSYYADNNS